MRLTAFAFATCLAAAPLAAQEEAPNADVEEGMSLLEEGARMLFRGLMSEMEPALRDMAREMDVFVENAEPMLRELARLMGDIQNYHPPEVLPNGDIIIRRKLPGEVVPEEEIEI